MRRNLPPLAALRAFESAARHASFTRAAEELFVTPGAISRQVKLLEAFLGQPLFERHTRKVAMTDFGRFYFGSVTSGLNEIEHATLKTLAAQRTLRCSIIPSTAYLWLIPRLTSFAEAHSDIEVDVRTSVRPADFEADDIDVAIRVGQRPGERFGSDRLRIPHEMVTRWEGVVAQHLCNEVMVAVCSRALAGHPEGIRALSDLRRQTLLHVAQRKNAWPDWLRAVGAPDLRGAADLEFGHYFMALQAAMNGRGVALASTLHVDNFDGGHHLVKLFDRRVTSAGGYYLLYRERDADSRKVRLFADWVKAEVSRVGATMLPRTDH